MNRIAPISVLAAFLLALSACGGTARGPYNPDASGERDPRAADERYRAAMAVIADDASEGEKLLRETLGLDLYHGGAHNNLGVLLLKQGKLYDAAEEFEWARKLLPGNPEPRCNLAIVLDRGGKPSEALDAARTALEIAPGHLGALQTLALIQVREGMTDEHTPAYLDALVMRGDERWRTWAEAQRLRLPPQP